MEGLLLELRHISKSFRSRKGVKRVLDDISFTFREGENMAILGGNGSGKSTLVRMMCGMELPDSGGVRREGSVSFPLGFAGAISPSMTGRDNVRFVARIYGANVPQVERFVYEFSELGRAYDLPVATYANSMRARLSYGLSMALKFDVYVADEMVAVGDPAFKRKCLEVFAERARNATVIIVSSVTTSPQRFCQSGMILENGRLGEPLPLAEAIARYGAAQPAAPAAAAPTAAVSTAAVSTAAVSTAA